VLRYRNKKTVFRQPVLKQMRTSFRLGLSPILLACMLAGCTSTSEGGRGLLSSRSSSSAQYITALQGGIVSRSGVTISDSDRSRALEAEYRALEAAPGFQPVVWKGRGVSGEVVAAAPYQVGSQNCRQYRHTLDVGGREVIARGAACRNANGTWTPLI
jgi:surface antigen